MILTLHDYADAARPYIRSFDFLCQKYNYSQIWAFTQIAQESAWDAAATSPVGAIGLCQIMPATAAGLGIDPSVPDQAIDGLLRLMSGYLLRYSRRNTSSLQLALAAYNAGPGAVDEYGGVPPYPETEEYVNTITATVVNAMRDWRAFYDALLRDAP